MVGIVVIDLQRGLQYETLGVQVGFGWLSGFKVREPRTCPISCHLLKFRVFGTSTHVSEPRPISLKGYVENA